MSCSGRFAAIDLGSNTFRFLIAECNDSGESQPWRTVCYRHHIVRLAEDLRHTGMLTDAAMQRGITALCDFRQLLDQYQVPLDHCRAVATAAMRMAGNADTFTAKVLAVCGVQIHVISGDEEAALSLRGCCAVLDAAYSEDMLLMDIGGGSTEFIHAFHGRQVRATSCSLGVVALTECFLQHNPPSASDYQAMLAACQPHLDEVERSWQGKAAPVSFVGTAGTVTTLAATMLGLCPYDANIINNTCMRWDDFVIMRDHLLTLTHEARQQLPTIEEERADLIIAGLAITEAVWQRWGYRELIVVDAGLLEGVLLNSG